MGKDQELLEAARNGNFSVVEKILVQRAKRSGPLASLRRGPGANVQDPSGYSALHHAALNGHKDIVELLLTHEASTNIVDVKGSSPLHLAAWTGNVDIVRLLLCHGPSVPNVNLTTKDNETALHCAAQYGHTSVVSQLLEHSCDPTIRNSKQETALDLAARYGRLETVDLLVRTHPELIQPYVNKGTCSSFATYPHTPLHLASRNGHKAVVEVLLSAGMDVNVRTSAGTALHEAALCGKLEVARTLLDSGVDLGVRDEHRNTVTDLLKQFPSHVVHEITNIISRHKAMCGELSDDDSRDNVLPPIPVPSLGSPYENVRVPSSHSPTQWDRRVSASSAISISSDNNNSGLSKSLVDSSYLSGSELYSSRHHGRHHDRDIRDLDQMSISSTASSTAPSPSPSPRGEIYLPMTPTSSAAAGNSKVSPTPPKKPPRRNLTVSPTHLQPMMMSMSADCAPTSGSGSAYEYLFLARSGVRSQGDLDDLPADGSGSKASSIIKQLRRGKSADQYVDMKLRHSVIIDHDNIETHEDSKYQPVAITSVYENIPFRTTNPKRKLRRITDKSYENYDPSIILSRGDLPFRKVEPSSPATNTNNDSQTTFISNAYITLKSSTESLLNGDCKKGSSLQMQNCPLSPTHYQQPPTPDHPPPSAMQAEKSIHDRIRPLSQEYCNLMKRRSRDIETETDEELLLLVFPTHNDGTTVSSGSLSSSVSLSDKSVSTDNNAVEEFVGDAPFAGLMKGSIVDGLGSGGGRAERPKTLRGRLRNVYEPKDDGTSSITTTTTSTTSSIGNTSTNTSSSTSQDKSLAILSPFDEQEEWAKISEIMASFGTGLVRESVFVTELEKEFQARLGLSRSESTIDSPCSVSSNVVTTVNQWLTSLGLSDYESLFIKYGYDHPDFINGVLDVNDLKDMGITSDKDRDILLESCRSLPCKVRDAFVNNSISNNVTNNSGSNNNNNMVIKDIQFSSDDSDDVKRQRLVVDNDKENSVSDNVCGSDNNSSSGVVRGPVDDWLSRLQLDEYCDTFRRHLYTEMEKVRRIWEVELTAVLEIEKPGHRKRILASLPPSGSRERQSQPAPNLEEINADLSQLKTNIQQLKEEIRVKLPAAQNTTSTGTGAGTGTASNTGTLRHSHKKNRPAPPPPPGAVASDLEIRAPSELLVGVPATLTTQWRHRPHALLAGHVTYVASYLGSTVVRDMKGTESTKKSIQKLKKTTSNEDKITPDIILAISYRGVKFLNTVNQDLVCEHEIRNIHCACQDAEDLTHFAYITKDHASKSHYCHVFCVQTMDQATEVILTLGQAFEVAYQMALRENFGTSSNRITSSNNGHTRSRSVNQVGTSQQQPSPITSQPLHQTNATNSSSTSTHGRSHSVNEIKIVNGTALSHQDSNSLHNQPTTPSGSMSDRRAPIVMTDDV
ncbi:ankyrin repeat and SAM domain-containing protein 1A-like [Lycorma delicatula]|uniref:ankyrin repeat and SAM domain-containing protein 1A-like n=1 Tax=Lycorma delicatula TaxID=130591 RepID=UPI003F50EE7D